MRIKTVAFVISACLLTSGIEIVAADEDVYQEKYRPQYHFSAKKGWLNDPNGLIVHKGTYHLFFQHLSTKHWGHATSSDLLHWTERDIAIYPQKGNQVFSGCAVYDRENTSGLGSSQFPPLVLVFTGWGEGQCLTYSTDDGQTWKRYDENPVLRLPSDEKRSWPLTARDPNVFWHKKTKCWVMALYENHEQKNDSNLPGDQQGGFGFYTSPDLKKWTFASFLPGFYVCPDLFELPVDGDSTNTKWVIMDWAQYAVGQFDGKRFVADGLAMPLDFGINLSANQTWKEAPGNRRIQISWLRGGKYPGMPFDQQMSIPVELFLRRTDGQVRLCKQPIPEVANLRAGTVTFSNPLTAGASLQVGVKGQSFDIEMEASLSGKDGLVIQLLGQTIRLTADKLECMGKTAALPSKLGMRDLRILADRTSLELFASDGAVTMSFCMVPPDGPTVINVHAPGGAVSFGKFAVHEMRSIWE